MQPTGWFQVAWSADLKIGEVQALHYFGRDLVAYRALDGQACVMDAHCQHLGANLAYGGCVVEDGIQCPFHGWVWNGQGRNVRIPYQDRPNRGRRIRSYPVTEVNESIFIWHDATGREPLWQLPTGFEMLGDHVASRGYHPFDANCRTRFPNVRVHPHLCITRRSAPWCCVNTPIVPRGHRRSASVDGGQMVWIDPRTLSIRSKFIFRAWG
jgi:phenylpropionate dioxygenase-like ring-hydroxylating dioxygenase large terminal subunit